MWVVVLVGGAFILFLGYRFRAIRIIGTVLAFLAIIFAPFITSTINSVSAPSDSSTIVDYDLDYKLAANGNLKLVETLDVQFTESKRGIFRFFDVNDAQDPDVKHPVTIDSIERCDPSGGCAPEPFTDYWEDGYYVAKIGVASKVYPAGTVNTYKITSTTTGAITQVSGESDYQWYWDVIPGGWVMPINKATVTATLPATPTKPIQCATGEGPCTASEVSGDTNTYSMSVTGLPPQTPGTWLATLPPAGLTAVPVTIGTSLWDNIAVKVVLVLLGAGAAVLFFFAIRKRLEPKPSEAPVFEEPSKDLLSATWTLKEEPAPDPFQSILLKLSEAKVVTIQPEMSGQTVSQKPAWFDITRTSEPWPPQLTGADTIINDLGISQPGSSIRIEKKSKTIGQKVQKAQASLTSQATSAALQDGYATRSGAGVMLHVLATILPVLALVAVVLTKSPFVGLLFALPAVAGWWSDKSLATSLTRNGLQMRDRVNGLRVALNTKASVERYDYSLKARYFMQFLPWAVALGCADEWAEACKPDDPSRASDPNYYAAMNYYYMSQAISSTVASVSEGAISSYSASQSSGGGGGGGFSAGGGSGGGGGGSW